MERELLTLNPLHHFRFWRVGKREN